MKTDSNSKWHVLACLLISTVVTIYKYLPDVFNVFPTIGIALLFCAAAGAYKEGWDWLIKPVLSRNRKSWLNTNEWMLKLHIGYSQYYPPKRSWEDFILTTFPSPFCSVVIIIIMSLLP